MHAFIIDAASVEDHDPALQLIHAEADVAPVVLDHVPCKQRVQTLA
jgi:hypothetical protein